jgi:hypothetical protein
MHKYALANDNKLHILSIDDKSLFPGEVHHADHELQRSVQIPESHGRHPAQLGFKRSFKTA